MKTTKQIIVKGVVFSLLPAMCSFFGSTEFLLWAQKKQYIGLNVDVESVKYFFFFLSIILTFGLLTVNLIVSEMRENKYRKQSTELIKYTKEIMVAALAKSLGKDYCNINIRIFVPRKSMLWKFMHMIKMKPGLLFEIKNIEGLAEAGVTENLKFRVLPEDKIEGLVGDCYTLRKMIFDDNLAVSNETDYNLSEYQINKTSDLRFIIVCPTFSEDGTIDSIVAFDSKNDIKVTNDNQEALSNLILNYTQQLHEKVPELFKTKGGIL